MTEDNFMSVDQLDQLLEDNTLNRAEAAAHAKKWCWAHLKYSPTVDEVDDALTFVWYVSEATDKPIRDNSTWGEKAFVQIRKENPGPRFTNEVDPSISTDTSTDTSTDILTDILRPSMDEYLYRLWTEKRMTHKQIAALMCTTGKKMSVRTVRRRIKNYEKTLEKTEK